MYHFDNNNRILDSIDRYNVDLITIQAALAIRGFAIRGFAIRGFDYLHF